MNQMPADNTTTAPPRAGDLSLLSKSDLRLRVTELLAAEALHVATIERLRGVIDQAHAAMELMHPRSEAGAVTDAEMARLWNATVEMLAGEG